MGRGLVWLTSGSSDSRACKRHSRVRWRVDPVKLDVEGVEIDVLRGANASDLNSCCQLTVEFHDRRPPLTRRELMMSANVCGLKATPTIRAKWPDVDDVLLVNLKSMPAMKRIELRCRVALANALFIIVEPFLKAVIVRSLCWNRSRLP